MWKHPYIAVFPQSEEILQKNKPGLKCGNLNSYIVMFPHFEKILQKYALAENVETSLI